MKIMVRRDSFPKARIKAGYSQRGLSRKIRASNSYISQLESGERNPSPNAAKRICDALGVIFDDIFFVDSGCNSEHIAKNKINYSLTANT